MMLGERNCSEPPDEDKNGLRGGFPIKINGFALGSQENLAEGWRTGRTSRESSCDRWGPRVRSRQSSVTPSEESDVAPGGRRLSLRGTTPVRNCAPPPPPKEVLDFSTPFGPVQGGRQGSKNFRSNQKTNYNSVQNMSSIQDMMNSQSFDQNLSETINTQFEHMTQSSAQNISANQVVGISEQMSSTKSTNSMEKSSAIHNNTSTKNTYSIENVWSTKQESVNEPNVFSYSNETSTPQELREDGHDVYSLPSRVTAQSLLSELEAAPPPLDYIEKTTLDTPYMKPETSPATWAATNAGPCTTTDFSLESSPPQQQPLAAPSSSFQLQRPRQFQPSPATARRLLVTPASPAQNRMANSTQNVSMTSNQSNTTSLSETFNQTETSTSQESKCESHDMGWAEVPDVPAVPRELAVQYGQQREVQFNSVARKEESSSSSTYNSSSTYTSENVRNEESSSSVKSSSVESGQLAHAICNMTETLVSFKADVELVDGERAEHVDAALQSMKQSLEVLREPSQPASSLDDVIGNMKDTLKAIRNDVNHKTLKELNREMTPFDLPALSPVPQKAEERVASQYDVSEAMRKDRVSARPVAASPALHKLSSCPSGADLFAESRDGSVRREEGGEGRGRGHGQESRKCSAQDEDVTELSVEASIVVQVDSSATRIGKNVWSMEEGAVAMQTNMAEQVVPVAMDKEEPNMPEMKELILPETEELITPEMMQQIMSDVKGGQGLIEEERGSFSLKDTTFQEELADLGIKRPSSPLPPSTSSSLFSTFQTSSSQTSSSHTSSSQTSSSQASSSFPSSYPSTNPSSQPSSCSSAVPSPSESPSCPLAAPSTSSSISSTSIASPGAPYSSNYLAPFPSSASSASSASDSRLSNSASQPASQNPGAWRPNQGAGDISKEAQTSHLQVIQEMSNKQQTKQSFESQNITDTSKVSSSQDSYEAQKVSQRQETSQTYRTSTVQTSSITETFNVEQLSQVEVNYETSHGHHETLNTLQNERKLSETSEASTLSLSERFAVDSSERYAATQATLRGDVKKEDTDSSVKNFEENEAEITQQEGCIVGRHKEVITACLEELELSGTPLPTSEIETLLDSSDTEHLERMRYQNSPSQPTFSTSPSCSSCLATEDDTTAKETDIETEIETETEDEEATSVKGGALFLTECSSNQDDSEGWGTKEIRKEKRKRNRTIDFCELPSTMVYECSVKDYHEKKYEGNEEKAETEEKEVDRVEIAKDGLGLILQRLHNIESKLDDLKSMETTILDHHESPVTRRHSLPGRIGSLSPTKPAMIQVQTKAREKEEQAVVATEDGEESSNCSTPTMMEPPPRARVNGYESDSTQVDDSDCEVEVEHSYRNFPMELNIEEMSEDEDPEDRRARIERMASSITVPEPKREFRRPEMNMEIDTLSERSEEEGEREEKARPRVRRMSSGRKRSQSREKNVAKIRYCWRCHHAGHENWQCQEDVQPGGWCPRCLESTHWEDACWVEAAHVLCPICSIPGHLPCVHQATDFRQRKLVIDTFGWLAFKEWFQDMTFRSWWNCSGFTGVPLYKIMQRNPTQDLDLGFEEQ